MSQKQYFKHYAEPEVNTLDRFPELQYNKVLCIPVYDEHPSFLESIQAAAKSYNRDILLIVVINQPEDVDVCEKNNELVSLLHQYPCIWKNDSGLQLRQLESLDILIVDRYSLNKKIPEKKGVGLARKIACDLAAKLFFSNHITEPQIYCSDADVCFPADYFSAKIPEYGSAAIFNFEHTNRFISEEDKKITEATLLYEKSLHHYVDGLHMAGSQYAYHTVGSSLLISTEHYTKVRGFPQRPAGEDFYLLNKLQKLAPVSNLQEPTITIQSRLSSRVPFGTGPAINKLLQSDIQDARIFYHPSCFDILGEWLTHLDHIAEESQTAPSEKGLFYNSQETTSYLKELEQTFNLQTTINKLFNTHKSVTSRKKHLHEWFDGFKTLKAVHYLRDHHFPSISYTELQINKQQIHSLENT